MPKLPDILPAGDVFLRRSRVADLDALMSAIESSRPELARWMEWADPMPTRAAQREFLEGRERAFDADDEWGYFLVERAGDELVGGAALERAEPGAVEIGYWVRSDRTGRGYATAAAAALTTAAFTYLPAVERVVIRTARDNVASAAIPPKLGFVVAGEETFPHLLEKAVPATGWVWVRTRTDDPRP